MLPEDRLPGGARRGHARRQARLNLATFVGNLDGRPGARLYLEAFDKNMIDKDEYRAPRRSRSGAGGSWPTCWKAPDPERAIGCSTIGSSEACMLGGLAFKRALAGGAARGRQARRPATW